MPSGAKKRKAAKKKKEQEATTKNCTNNTSSAANTNSNPLGNDDHKSHDERESDGDEVNSPAAQDHQNHQHPFKEGSEEPEKTDSSSVRSFDSENKPMDEVARELEGKEKLRVEDDDAIKIETEMKSDDLGSENISIKHIEFMKELHDGSSSGSTSDNESEAVEKTSKKDAYVSHKEENKPVDSFPKEEIQGTKKALFEVADNLVLETAPAGDLGQPLEAVSEEVINVTQGELAENLVLSDLVESRLKENESKRNEEKVCASLEENVGASVAVVETVPSGNEDKVLPTSGAPTTKTSNGAEHIKDSKIPDSSETQPLIALAPQVEQRTSWMSCCGLFDVLMGSGR